MTRISRDHQFAKCSFCTSDRSITSCAVGTASAIRQTIPLRRQSENSSDDRRTQPAHLDWAANAGIATTRLGRPAPPTYNLSENSPSYVDEPPENAKVPSAIKIFFFECNLLEQATSSRPAWVRTSPALSLGIVIQIRPQPPLHFCDAHSLALRVIFHLVAIDSTQLKVSRLWMGEIESAHARTGPHGE
jgi:hypothetical protein